jgi:hypothetical protein
MELITAVKSFMTLAPGANIILEKQYLEVLPQIPLTKCRGAKNNFE